MFMNSPAPVAQLEQVAFLLLPENEDQTNQKIQGNYLYVKFF